MAMITLNYTKTQGSVTTEEVYALKSKAMQGVEMLHKGNGKGNDFLGWLSLPSSISDSDMKDIEAAAVQLSRGVDVVVVIGIGGSYLGAKAVVDALSSSFDMLQSSRKHPHILFAGQNIGEDYTYELLKTLEGKSVSCIVISKSGTTTEPAIAFRLIKDFIERKYGKEEAKKRIVAITDRSKGALRTTANQEGYKTFVIPDDVGGRFSVLTPVGLLPIACAGFNIKELLRGAADIEK
ncbi:MAG: glucose-6-phosphate isomerase, partial [Prevotellaceae bacterium]|nr:glucose-6-phosphate isomerase [Prevotellaceae bacterium]